MRISADVASIISTERMVVIEHEFDGVTRKVTFPLSLYKKNHFAQDNETFQVINEYWASLTHHAQGEIYRVYEDVRELFDSVTGNTELKIELTKLVTQLMEYHRTKDVKHWILYNSQLKVPSDVKREYVYDVDKNTTEDKTYTFDDYVGLMSLSVIFRAMIPIWAMHNKPAKDAIGKTLKEMSSFMLLQNSEVYRSEPMERLIRYIKANINKDTYTGNHTLFGHVHSGMDVVHAIVQGDWVDHVRIVRVGEKARTFKADTAAFRAMVAEAEARVKAADEKKAKEEASIIRRNWRKAKPSPKGALFLLRRAGRGEPPATGETVKVRYTGKLLDGRPIASSADEGRPVPGVTAETFDYVIGKTRINPALDEAIAEMRKGERRTVIAQGQMGYGRSGFTAKEKPGEKRFVISPNTTLVYEVEVIK